MKKFIGILFALFLMGYISFAAASQHDYVVDNGPGATVRADMNTLFQAIVTNNSGATEPATLYANMWWYDTSTGLLKRRNNANDAWITLGLEAADTDGTLAANSDSKLATQKATKTYADTKISKSTAGEINALTEKTTLSDNDLLLLEDSESSYAKKKVKRSNLLKAIDSLLPTQTGNSGKYLTTNGSSSSWGSITQLIANAYDYSTSTSSYTNRTSGVKVAYGYVTNVTLSGTAITNLPFSSSSSYVVIITTSDDEKYGHAVKNSASSFTVYAGNTDPTDYYWFAIGT